MAPEGAEKTYRTRFILLCVAGFGVLFALVFGPAGRLDWIAGWLYFLLTTLTWAGVAVVLRRYNPELLRRRMFVGEGSKRWDCVMLGLLRVATLAILGIAGMDAVRFEWTDMSIWFWPLGVGLHASGTLIVIWAMAVNAHFEGTVRIQRDRDHRVVVEGPYRYVRHPGYVGFSLVLLAIPFLLASWWATVPACAAVACLVLRTDWEDQTLREELEGYSDYALRVCYRLLPKVW